MTIQMRAAIFLMMAAMTTACGMQHSSRAASADGAFQDVYVPSGTTTPTLSMGFEAAYDPRLDNVIPGYKILTVAITNSALEYLQMDPLVDQWWVIDRSKSKHKAILTLRDKNPDVWAKLPPRLRQIIEYPLMVRIADTATIDLLFPNNVRLNEFREVVFRSSSRQKIIHIVPRE
jgi:hypothetical protein